MRAQSLNQHMKAFYLKLQLEQEEWELQNQREWWVCPDSARRNKDKDRAYTCDDKECQNGQSCKDMAAYGLSGDGEPLPKAKRPKCGAKTRAGGECQAHVVPGKKRCRMHGGLSTGPKTKEGRAKIAEAQCRRWVAIKSDGMGC